MLHRLLIIDNAAKIDNHYSTVCIKRHQYHAPGEFSVNGQQILNLLKQEKPYLESEYGVLSIGLFGSYVRDAQDSESDVDLLIELKEPSFDLLAGLHIYLEEKIGKPVEIIRKRPGLSKRFLNRISNQVQYA